MRTAERILSAFIFAAVRFYKRFISPLLPPSCRYYPSCSEYLVLAVKKNGPFYGLLQGIGRISRCNPLFPGGVDFPSERRRVRKW